MKSRARSIEGDRLDEYVAKNKLSTREILDVFVRVCEAVNYAHQRGVIHRDLKPSNILVDEEGQSHIVDFGLAKLGDSTPGEAQPVSFTGQVMGTLSYMSPEQASGQPDAVDNRSDVYSLAVILYRLITGRSPYDLDSSLSRNLLTIQDSNPLPMKRVSHELATIVFKGLAKEPDRRYQSAGDLGQDIGRFLRGKSIDAKRDSILYLLRKTMQRHRVATGVVFVFSSLILASTIVGWGLYLDAQRERDIARRLREDSQRQLYFAKMNLAGQVILERFGADTVRAALESWIPIRNNDVDLRGWEWYYLKGIFHREEFQSELLKGWSWEADYNSDCSEYVVAINGWGLQVREASSGRILREHFSGTMRSIDWSNDGAVIVSGNMRGEVELFDAQTLQSIWKRNVGIGTRIAPVRMSPNGKAVAVSSVQAQDQRDVLILDASDGSVIQKIPRASGSVNQLQWSPDSTIVALSFNVGDVSLWDASTGELIRELLDNVSPGPETGVPPVAWGSDGAVLAGGRPLRVWDFHNGRESNLNTPFRALAIAWHPDGSSIACGCEDGVVRVIDHSGELIHEFNGHTNACSSIRWSSDGKQLLSCGLKDRTVRTWKVETTDRTQVIAATGSEAGVEGIAWSPDGKLIAFTRHYETSIDIWDVHKRKRVFSFEMPDNQGDRIAFSPDGRQLAWTAGSGAHFLDLQSQTSSTLVDSPRRSAPTLDWHSNGKLAVAFREPVACVVVWDSDGTKYAEFRGESGVVANSLGWNSTGERLAMAGALSGKIYLWDVEHDQLQWQVTAGNVEQVLRSDNDETLITSLRGAIVIRDAKTGQEINRLDSVRELFGKMDYSPQANRLAVGSSSSLSLWDLASGQVAIKFKEVVSGTVRWSPDGRCVAAGCRDGVRLWDAGRGYALLRAKK